jgi:hypothetical protein
MADPGHVSAEAQRAEFETVVEALGSSSRLARLLRFMGEKYFAGKIGELQEFNIATEVFGRSPTAFDPSQDAIASGGVPASSYFAPRGRGATRADLEDRAEAGGFPRGGPAEIGVGVLNRPGPRVVGVTAATGARTKTLQRGRRAAPGAPPAATTAPRRQA